MARAVPSRLCRWKCSSLRRAGFLVVAKHHGFTGAELDFIVNYDIKHRMTCNAQVIHAVFALR